MKSYWTASKNTACFLPLTMCAVPCCILAFSQGVEANQVAVKKEAVVHKAEKQSGIGIEARIGAGYLQGEANGFVYHPWENHTASQLTWTLDSIFMIGAGMTLRPASWLEINADVWTSVTEGDSTMDDWDWFFYNSPEWTHWSHHDDVPVTDGLIVDLNANIPFYKKTDLSIYAIFGYLRDNWSWEGKGGSYIYTVTGFRSHRGVFPEDQIGITYEQTFDTPYLGLGLESRFNSVTLKARLIGSSLVSCEAVDYHLERSLKTVDDFSDGTMIGLTGEVVYDLTSSFSLGAAVNYTQYGTMTGDSNWDFYGEGYSVAIQDGAGTDLERTLFTLSMSYQF